MSGVVYGLSTGGVLHSNNNGVGVLCVEIRNGCGVLNRSVWDWDSPRRVLSRELKNKRYKRDE